MSLITEYCSWCKQEAKQLAKSTRLKEETLCERCQKVSDAADKFFEENKELMEELRKHD